MHKRNLGAVLGLVLAAAVAIGAVASDRFANTVIVGNGVAGTKSLTFDIGGSNPLVESVGGVLKLSTDGGSTLMSVPAATDTLVGKSTTDILSNKTIPTAGLTFAGSSSGNTVVKAGATASGTLTLPAATDTLVGKATPDTLTNKTLTSPTITTPAISTPTVTGNWTSAGTFTSNNNVLVSPTGLDGSWYSTNGGLSSGTAPSVSIANDIATAGSAKMILETNPFPSHSSVIRFAALNSAGKFIQGAAVTGSSTGSAGSETGAFSICTKTSASGCVTALSIDDAQLATFGGAIKLATTRGTLVSDSAGAITANNTWTSGAMLTAVCTSGTCSSATSYGGGINSISWSAVGTYDVNFTGSFWSAGPVCTASHNTTSVAGVYCGIKTLATTTKVVVECDQTTGSANNLLFNVICVGTRL